jgi:hypothetical protein
MTRLKVKRAHALIVGLLPPPLGVERFAPIPVIVVDGVGVETTDRPFVMEK